MSAPAAWMVAGLALAALEMLAPGVFLLWIGCAAIATGAAAALIDLGGHFQIGWFVVLTAALIGAAALRLRRRPRVRDLVNAPSAGLIGQTCRALDFRDGQGRVALGDGAWQARLVSRTQAGVPSGQPIAGEALEIVGLDGTTLLVAANA